MSELRGTRWVDGMAVHGSDLSRESLAWKSSLTERFSNIADYGIVDPENSLLILPRNGADALELYITDGKCFPKSMEPIEIISPQGGPTGFSFWLQTPENPDLASDPHFVDPDTGNSLLLGDPTGPNLIWLIYWPETSRPAVTADDTVEATEYIQSFKVFVSPATATISSVPQFFWKHSDRAVLIGVVTPKSSVSVSDAVVDLTQSVYPYNRPVFSGRDEYARKKITDYNLLLDTYPNAYVERRSSAVGNTYGDVYSETFVSADIYRDDLSGKYTGIPGTFFVKTTHFPKLIVSATRSDGVDMLGNADIVARKKYIALDPVGNETSPIPDGGTLEIVYAYYNVAEPYLNKSTNPDSVTVSQPLENEMVLVESNPMTVLTADTKIPSENAQYPAEYTFFINKLGEVDVKPRILFQARDIRRISDGDVVMPSSQPTRPTRITCCVTGTKPGTQGLQFTVYGTDGSGAPISENITVKATSVTETKPGLGNNGEDWTGYYESSTSIFGSVTGLEITDLDKSSPSASNKDATVFVLSNEGIDLLHDLPNCKVTIDAAGDALEWTFVDLRDTHIYQSMLSFLSSCKQVTILDGAVKAYLPAGEYIKQGQIVYIKPGEAGHDPPQDSGVGYLYRAVAENDAYKPNVAGIADTDIQAGQSGWVTLRGVVVNNNWDFRPGVLYLSSSEPGNFSTQYPFQYSGSGAETLTVQIVSDCPEAYVHLNINGYDYYSNVQPAGAPIGSVFTWDADPAITAQNLTTVINGTTDSKIAGVVTATSDGSVVTIKSTKKSTPIRVYQIGDPNTEKLAILVYASNAILNVWQTESGSPGTPSDGDAFSVSGTLFVYNTDWVTATELATQINSKFGGAIAATAQGGSQVLLQSSTPYMLGTMIRAFAGYGNAALSFDSETFKAAETSISPELLRYKPTVRCGYAITSSKILFDGPIFSKKYASEIYVEDYYRQYKSNQTEGCLVELPKFITMCRSPLIVPVAGAAPIFHDDDSPEGTGYNRMFVWVQGFTSDSAVIAVAIKRRETATTDYNWYLDRVNNHGSFILRVLPDCHGEISGFRNYGYPDKTGQLIGDDPKMSLKTGAGASLLDAGALCKNPYSQYEPPKESWGSGDPDPGVYITDTDAWEYYGTNGHDMFRFVDEKTIQFGFRESTAGDSFRCYVSGFDRYTILELSIGKRAHADGTTPTARIKFFALGWNRVNFFSVEGDKLRFYLTPRCSEPWIYNPSAGDSDPGLAPAATSPRECKVLEVQRLPRICTKYE